MLHPNQSPGRASLQAGTALHLLAQAAMLSERLRAKSAPLDQAAWDLDSKAAMIRRHANGPATPHVNGTAEEHEALRRSMVAADALISGRDDRAVILADGISLEVISEAAALLLGARGVMRDMAALFPASDVKPSLNREGTRWLNAVDEFAAKARMTFDALGGNKRRAQARKLLEDEMTTLLPGILAKALGLEPEEVRDHFGQPHHGH